MVPVSLQVSCTKTQAKTQTLPNLFLFASLVRLVFLLHILCSICGSSNSGLALPAAAALALAGEPQPALADADRQLGGNSIEFRYLPDIGPKNRPRVKIDQAYLEAVQKTKIPGRSALFPEGCIYHSFLEQPGKSALFPEEDTKFTTGQHNSIFLEEVHFFVWFFPKKCTSSWKFYSNFGFWNSLLVNSLKGSENGPENHPKSRPNDFYSIEPGPCTPVSSTNSDVSMNTPGCFL